MAQAGPPPDRGDRGRTMRAMSLPALASGAVVTVAAGAITPCTLSAELVRHGTSEVSRRAQRLRAEVAAALREVTLTASALRTVLVAVADAVEDGFVDELRTGLRDVGLAVELMDVVTRQLDQAMPVLDATAPTLGVMNSTLAQLDGTLAQLDALPGVRMARRFVGRPGAPQTV